MTASPTGNSMPRRLMVLGWDGASWDLLLPLLQAGKLPNLRALMAAGSYGNLFTIKPTLSNVVWTSIATGVPPSTHGVLDFVRRPYDRAVSRLSPEERGKLHFYSSLDRRSKALWNLVSDSGRPVLVIGYHNTYPAEQVLGMLVSNYLVREHLMLGFEVRPQSGESPARLVYPAGEAGKLAAFQRPLSAIRFEEVGRFADIDAATFAAWSTSPPKVPAARERWDYLRRAYLYDEFHARVAIHYLPTLKPTLLMLHFQAVDWAGHYFLAFHDRPFLSEAAARRPARQESRYTRTVTEFYEYLDDWLGRILALRDADTAVVVVSDHGFEHELDAAGQGYHDDAPPGVIIIQGPGIRAGNRIEGATIYDVLPTLAAMLDLAVARDLPGHVLDAVFEAASFRPDRIHRVATYGQRPAQAGQAPPEDLARTLEEELRSVGYVR